VQPEFWHERWRSAQIGFHQSTVDRHLQAYWPKLKLSAGSHVFVPLCGKSLDLLWLRDQGHMVAGVELSAVALESFCMEHGIPARRRPLGDFDVYQAEGLTLFRGDFFALRSDMLRDADAVYDRAALISWAPTSRAAYVRHMSAVTARGTQTLLIVLEYRQDQMSGPPFSVSAEDVERLYAQHHDIHLLGREDILADEPRLRSRGLTALHEVCYHLTRTPKARVDS
jgi:thiopurine S-methyltransferase